MLYNLDKTILVEYSSVVEAVSEVDCAEKTIKRALEIEKDVILLNIKRYKWFSKKLFNKKPKFAISYSPTCLIFSAIFIEKEK